MTKEELKKKLDNGWIIDQSLIPDELIDVGIHFKEFLDSVNQWWKDCVVIENNLLANSCAVIRDYFRLVEKLRKKIDNDS